jgi:hypothetical protein
MMIHRVAEMLTRVFLASLLFLSVTGAYEIKWVEKAASHPPNLTARRR